MTGYLRAWSDRMGEKTFPLFLVWFMGGLPALVLMNTGRGYMYAGMAAFLAFHVGFSAAQALVDSWEDNRR